MQTHHSDLFGVAWNAFANWSRHDECFDRGFYSVMIKRITGWADPKYFLAVVDDFGSMVSVGPAPCPAGMVWTDL